MQGRRTNWSSLFFGLVFLGVAALLLSGQVGVLTSLRWAGPILLIVIALCLIGWAVAERPRPAPSTPQVAPPSPWGAGAGIPGTAAPSWSVASGPGVSAPVPAQEPGGGTEADDPGDASAPEDPPSPAG